MNFNTLHSVWKSQKKSHSTLRAKRATFTFWVDKSSLKMPKMVNFGEFLKTWILRSNSVTRQVILNSTKISGKCQNQKIQMRHFVEFSNNVRNHDYVVRLDEVPDFPLWKCDFLHMICDCRKTNFKIAFLHVIPFLYFWHLLT